MKNLTKFWKWYEVNYPTVTIGTVFAILITSLLSLVFYPIIYLTIAFIYAIVLVGAMNLVLFYLDMDKYVASLFESYKKLEQNIKKQIENNGTGN